MKNVLFATVRQGNCGDEFILFGTQNIISSLQPGYNSIIVNKNSEVCRRLLFRFRNLNIQVPGMEKPVTLNLEELCFKNRPLEDNSFADYYSLDFIDAVVFAGTPEWIAYKLLPLYQKLETYKGPILFLGLGFHEGFDDGKAYPGLNDVYKRIHKRADVFIVRDRLLMDYVTPEIQATLLPCPALFSSETQRQRTSVRKIGISLQAKEGDAVVNFVSRETYAFGLRLVEAISNHYDVEVVCHWIEDLICLRKDLGDKYVLRYSYDAKDYLKIYDQYDLVISTRVHGAGMAASLGIPSFTISHSARTDTVNGFLSHVITPDDDPELIVDRIAGMDPGKESARLIAHKSAVLGAYQKCLRPYFPL
ncbi:MAG: hypothetical protein CVU57_00545 [Deltaproteobacteria bacterium HGW-Deltaproteobacteria-15]|jgi:polysaccharide pyruvyl transferase WcaK-like protein|nr:MAG: hypothetical protein CVU57_00545 [Deltaproteobacteria bacterium HGW-Deltaproteobacteria-15]